MASAQCIICGATNSSPGETCGVTHYPWCASLARQDDRVVQSGNSQHMGYISTDRTAELVERVAALERVTTELARTMMKCDERLENRLKALEARRGS